MWPKLFAATEIMEVPMYRKPQVVFKGSIKATDKKGNALQDIFSKYRSW